VRKGVTPFSAELPLGKHRVGVEIDGYALNERQAELTADTSVTLDFTLEKRTETVPLVAASPDVVPASISSASAQPAVVPAAALPAPTAASTEPAPRARTWTWVGAGVTAAALATAVGFGLSAQGQSQELMSPPPRTGREATLLRDGAKGHATTSNILYGVAGVAGAATVGLFFFEGEF
jgi:PEGA domain